MGGNALKHLDPVRWVDMIRQARIAATQVAVGRGITTQVPPAIPAFVPTP